MNHLKTGVVGSLVGVTILSVILIDFYFDGARTAVSLFVALLVFSAVIQIPVFIKNHLRLRAGLGFLLISGFSVVGGGLAGWLFSYGYGSHHRFFSVLGIVLGSITAVPLVLMAQQMIHRAGTKTEGEISGENGLGLGARSDDSDDS